jgi:UrcA family protein
MSSNKTFGIARQLVVGALAALSFGAAAHAGDVTLTDSGAPQVVVRYSDLDLSREAGVRALYARLQRASDEVCGQYRHAAELSRKHLYKACYEDTLSHAVESVDHTAVTAMFTSDDRIQLAERRAKARSAI